MATAHHGFHPQKGDVKNAFQQGRIDESVQPGELAAEPVPELREAMGLRPEEIVTLSKACYGLIDAPRRWWKALVADMQALGWRSCRNEPCLMTWHLNGKLTGRMCFHVDDAMASGDPNDKLWVDMVGQIKGLCVWGDWEQGTCVQCGSRVRHLDDYSSTLGQESCAGTIAPVPLRNHRRVHMHATLTPEERSHMVANTAASPTGWRRIP